jgi:hypothetical protein
MSASEQGFAVSPALYVGNCAYPSSSAGDLCLLKCMLTCSGSVKSVENTAKQRYSNWLVSTFLATSPMLRIGFCTRTCECGVYCNELQALDCDRLQASALHTAQTKLLINDAVMATERAAVSPAGMIFFVRLYLEIMTIDSSPEKNMATMMFMRAAAPTILRALRAMMRADPPAETRDFPLPFFTYAKMPPAAGKTAKKVFKWTARQW